MFGLYFNGIFAIILIGLNCAQALDNCSDSESPFLCHGSRVVREVVDNVLTGDYTEKPFKLVPGLEIVKIESPNESIDVRGDQGARSQSGYLERVLKYLQGHELRINLHDVMKKTEFGEALSRTMKDIDSDNEVIGKSILLLKRVMAIV